MLQRPKAKFFSENMSITIVNLTLKEQGGVNLVFKAFKTCISSSSYGRNGANPTLPNRKCVFPPYPQNLCHAGPEAALPLHQDRSGLDSVTKPSFFQS